MKLVQIAAVFGLVLLPCATTRATITIDTVPVGNVGNANDPVTHLYGGVNDAYRIGTYEVTVGQYTAFLKAVAKTDTYNLYHTNMATDLNIAGIARSGVSGSYDYSVIGSENQPVTYVSWGDAARFANWLHNGQPTGAQVDITTERGAYTLDGATSSAALMLVSRNAGAVWVIPTENEWYKAAFHQPATQGGDSDNYWTYPMKTNSVPFSDTPPGSTIDNRRVGNFYSDDGTPNGYNSGYAVTASTSYSSSQNYLTDVGAYDLSPSYYGTFDQAGNVMEWNETAVISSQRGLRGGSWHLNSNSLQAADRGNGLPAIEFNYIGFRVASIPALIPEPNTAVLAASIFALLVTRRRRRS